jgi:hypothetical protein
MQLLIDADADLNFMAHSHGLVAVMRSREREVGARVF